MDKKVIYYMYEKETCAKIVIEYAKGELTRGPVVSFENYTNNIIKRPFGVREHATYEDLRALLETRCFPRSRVNAKQLLRDADIDFYDAFQIVAKTHGVMSDDLFWVRFQDEEPELWDSIKCK